VKKTQLKKRTLALLACAILALPEISAQSQEVFELQPVTVTGDLLSGSLDRLPASVSLVGADWKGIPGNLHFGDLASRMPNLNWAGSTSRPRFFQIRGIGDSTQFGNEVPASSVGFIIDGIDFTGIGSVAGLFDVEQVEVLRGPQAAAFGANALAGMIVIDTADPTRETTGHLRVSLGDYDLVSFGAAVGGPIGREGSSTLGYRISVSQYRDNGFRENTFLDRDDTNARDERNARLKLAWRPSDRFDLDLTLAYFDMENGYDAWSLTNNSFVTTTDEPGQDDQESVAASLKATWHLGDSTFLQYLGSASDSDLLYSFDWDWSNVAELMELYGPEVYWGTDVTDRHREVQSHDLRLASGEVDRTAWVTGVYFRDFEEEQLYFGTRSTYGTETAALYGQARIALTQALGLTVAGRLENLSIDYNDDSGTRLGNEETPWGGKLALEYALDGRNLVYASLDRGFKAGGINMDNEIPADYRVYETETLVNYELGWKALFLDEALNLQVAAFYMERRDIQVDSSIQVGDGNTFALYKDNAASGHNYGLELESTWKLTGNLSLRGSLGLLKARFDEYRYIDPVDGVTEVVLDGRDQAYAPSYTYSLGFDYVADNGYFLGASLDGRDGYTFELPNDQSLDGYQVLNLRLGYRADSWMLTLWVNNLLDETHDTHGFYFANEPPLYDQQKKWVTQGPPRLIGATLDWKF